MLREFGELEPKPQFLIFVGDIVAGNSVSDAIFDIMTTSFVFMFFP